MIKHILKKLCLFLIDITVDNDEKQNSVFRNYLYKKLGFHIGNNVLISKKIDFICPENIYLEDNCCIGQYNQIQAFNKVIIGEYCHFATNITIIAGSHNNDDFTPKSNQEITIGAGTWIGANVTILGGVTVGKGCIIGAGSIVNKDIPDFSIAVGNPCKVIKKREPAEKIWHPTGFYNLSELRYNQHSFDDGIPIFLASDDNYAPYLCTAMYSILEKTKSNINFYILDGGISQHSKNLIKKSLNLFKNYYIEYIDMSNYGLDRFPNLRHYSLNTFSRYFIPELKPHLGKVLYLDVDIIVKSDIAELYNQDIEDYPLGAVLEDFYGLNGQYIQEHIDANFKSGRKSFNAGILILDIQKFIKNNYEEILINKTIELADKLSCPDQDVLNIIFENNYKILDYKFNFMIDLYDKFEAMYPQKAKETLRNYSIVHYVSHKPWKNKNSKAQKDFENIANKTNFSEIIKLSLEKNLCNNDLELSFIERLFSIKNHPNKKHKVITIMGIKFKIKRKQK